MADQTLPKITAAAFTVNPASMNTQTVLSVTITEIAILTQQPVIVSGQHYCGEV